MKTDRIIITIFLLFAIYASAVSNYIGSGNVYFINHALIFGLLDCAIATFCMTITPLIFVIANKGKLDIKKGKKICLVNSLLLLGISIIFTAVGVGGITGGLGAIAFYFINKWLFVKDFEEKIK